MWIMRPSRKSGFFLIATLIILSVVAIVMVASVSLMPSGSDLATSAEDQAAAIHAAESGLQYAHNRLQQDPTWRGDGPGLPGGSPDGSLFVIEDTGNVFGFIRSPGGERSMFRIRFNYQDGAGNEVGGPLPNPGDPINNIYVSVNNLNSGSPIPVPRADGTGWSVTTLTGSYECPRYTACVIVEGLAGPALQEVVPGNPDPDMNRRMASRVAEAYFQRKNADLGDAALMTSGVIDADLVSGAGSGQFIVASEDTSTPAKVRSNRDIDIQASGTAQYITPATGQVMVGLTNTFSVDTPPPVTATQEDSSPYFPSFTWDQLTRADQATDLNIDAGTYVWRGGNLEYYDQDYTGTVPTGPPTRVITNTADLDPGTGSLIVSSSLDALIIKKDIFIRATGSSRGFAVVPENNTAPTRPQFVFDPPAGADVPILTVEGDSSVSGDGNVSLEGEILGKGSVTADGDISFQGPSVVEADPNTAVALYAQGDINVLAIPDAVVAANPDPGSLPPPCCAPPLPPWPSGAFGNPSYSDVFFGGILYAHGNINANLNTVANQGNLHVQGVAIAYGGNPNLNEGPGASLPGVANLQVRNAEFRYDPTYAARLQNMTAPTELERTYYHEYN